MDYYLLEFGVGKYFLNRTKKRALGKILLSTLDACRDPAHGR